MNTISISDSIKDKVLSFLKNKTVNAKELEDISKELMKIPNLDDEIIPISKSLINASSFEISKKEKVNPIYFRNLLNVIILYGLLQKRAWVYFIIH